MSMSNPLAHKTILAIDDDQTNLDILLDILNDYDVVPAISARDGLDVLEIMRVDLILLDIRMPEMDGLTLCTNLKANPATREIPVIFLTALDTEGSIERAFAVGGCDYVTKPFKRAELRARANLHLRFRDMIRDLNHLANHDPLTGLLNRRRFFELATASFDQPEDECVAMMIDIDYFKLINDRYGHASGDATLKQVAHQIASIIPATGILGRVGGEEFALILPRITDNAARELAERLRCGVAESSISAHNCGLIRCTISIGVARRTSCVLSLDQLLYQADTALYDAKTQGRDRAIVHTS